IGDIDTHCVAHQLGQFEYAVRFRNLVQHADAGAVFRGIGDGQFNTAHGVRYVDQRARLAAGPVHGQRVPDGALHEEPVEHGAVVAVIVEPVDQPLVQAGLVGLRAPHDALVQVGDP